MRLSTAALYRYFALIGGPYEIASIIAGGVLAYLTRKRGKTFKWTLLSVSCSLLAFLIWLGAVLPVNQQIAGILQRNPRGVPDAWMLLRGQWEYGHAAGFVFQLIGLCCLTASILVETPVHTSEEQEWESGGARRIPHFR